MGFLRCMNRNDSEKLFPAFVLKNGDYCKWSLSVSVRVSCVAINVILELSVMGFGWLFAP